MIVPIACAHHRAPRGDDAMLCARAVAAFGRFAAHGAPDDRRLGSAGCWKNPARADGASKRLPRHCHTNDVFKTSDCRLANTLFALRTSHFAPNPASRKTLALSRPGGHRGVPPPVPIPNTAVKRPSAYGTSSQDAGESVAARSAKRKSSSLLITHPQTNPIPRGGAAR